MLQRPVYLDNHATTRIDPRVLEAMLPYLTDKYGNAGSTSHTFGGECRDAVEQARAVVAQAIHASPREIVFTSGATESNNLAIRGLAEHRRRAGNHVVSVATEHKSVLDPLARLARHEVRVTLLPVAPHDQADAGRVDLTQLTDAMGDDTFLVSVMLANNEIGTIQPLAEIGPFCRQRGIALHTDATQAVGKMPVDVQTLQVDLLSLSAHKLYGPKGVGALYVRRAGGRVRLLSQLDGGGQEGGLRSGTLNVPGIVGLARAIELSISEMESERSRLAALRQRLLDALRREIPDVVLNGPHLAQPDWRLPGNLNCQFPGVDGEAVMLNARDVAVSSGSACTSANPEPSHVLRALGLNPDQVRSSLRFGLGRFTTAADIDVAVTAISRAVVQLRGLHSLGGSA
ncbi:MAG: cysteine desulfurase [Pirellulaceae bacterium]|jgi:cysteine desulfurase|nr:cysteine desulfurase [Pirellulaceae bacterium]